MRKNATHQFKRCALMIPNPLLEELILAGRECCRLRGRDEYDGAKAHMEEVEAKIRATYPDLFVDV